MSNFVFIIKKDLKYLILFLLKNIISPIGQYNQNHEQRHPWWNGVVLCRRSWSHPISLTGVGTLMQQTMHGCESPVWTKLSSKENCLCYDIALSQYPSLNSQLLFRLVVFLSKLHPAALLFPSLLRCVQPSVQILDSEVFLKII